MWYYFVLSSGNLGTQAYNYVRFAERQCADMGMTHFVAVQVSMFYRVVVVVVFCLLVA